MKKGCFYFIMVFLTILLIAISFVLYKFWAYDNLIQYNREVFWECVYVEYNPLNHSEDLTEKCYLSGVLFNPKLMDSKLSFFAIKDGNKVCLNDKLIYTEGVESMDDSSDITLEKCFNMKSKLTASFIESHRLFLYSFKLSEPLSHNFDTVWFEYSSKRFSFISDTTFLNN